MSLLTLAGVALGTGSVVTVQVLTEGAVAAFDATVDLLAGDADAFVLGHGGKLDESLSCLPKPVVSTSITTGAAGSSWVGRIWSDLLSVRFPGRNHELEELLLGVALPYDASPGIDKSFSPKDARQYVLHGHHPVVELRVADHVVQRSSFCQSRCQRSHMNEHVVTVLVHISSERLAALRNACNQLAEARVRNLLRSLPLGDSACRYAPGAADCLPVQFAGVASVLQISQPVHVRSQFPNVAHPVWVGWRCDHNVGRVLELGNDSRIGSSNGYGPRQGTTGRLDYGRCRRSEFPKHVVGVQGGQEAGLGLLEGD